MEFIFFSFFLPGSLRLSYFLPHLTKNDLAVCVGLVKVALSSAVQLVPLVFQLETFIVLCGESKAFLHTRTHKRSTASRRMTRHTSVPFTHCLTKYKGLFLGNKENDLKDSRGQQCVLLRTYELISEFSQQLVYCFCRGDLVKKERNIF